MCIRDSHCIGYLSVSLFLAPACILQLLFQAFFVTAGKPTIGLILTISGGVANMILDYLFMGPLEMGVRGAAPVSYTHLDVYKRQTRWGISTRNLWSYLL